MPSLHANKSFNALIMKLVYPNFRRDITVTESYVFLQAEDRSKLKKFRAMMTDCLWWFMQNTCQLWNQDLMAFLCTGVVEVVITMWHLCC